MSLLTPDFGLLFWMAISFVIVFVLLARFGFPVITKAVDKRNEYIRKSLDAADEANLRLGSVNVEADRLTTEARQKHAMIVKQAAADGEGIVQNARDRAAAEREQQLIAARRQIELQKEKAMAAINAEVASMAIEIAEKILREQLDDPQRQHALALRMLEEMEAEDGKGDN